MKVPYQIWRHWVESQKGLVTDELMSKPDEMEGLKPLALLLEFRKHNDFGHYLTGEIRSYCQIASPRTYAPVPGSCRYLLRRAYVPLNAEAYNESNPVADWTRANFNPPALVRHFRAIGLAPNTDWWGADRKKMFATAPSPRDVLARNAVVVRLDSIECPQMGKAVEALEGVPLDVKIDLATIGADGKLAPPWPHSITSTTTLHLRANGAALSVEGSGGRMKQLIGPVLDAADACEKARQG